MKTPDANLHPPQYEAGDSLRWLSGRWRSGHGQQPGPDRAFSQPVRSKPHGFNFRSWLRLAMIFYLCASLPVVAIFTFSEYVRFVSMNTVTHWRGKILGLPAAFIGDSITAGGRCWGTKIGDDPFAAINLGADGSTVRQIKAQLDRAARYKPHTLFILAGTNDILAQGGEFDIAQFERDYRELLVAAVTNAQAVVVTLIPFTASGGHSMNIDRANAVILELCQEQKIRCIDLNPELAPGGILLSQFTVDGVHFSRAAYQIWSGLLKSAAKSPPTQPDSLAIWSRPIYRQPNLSAWATDFK